VFFMDCESGSGASLDAQGISGGLWPPASLWCGLVWGWRRMSVAVLAWVSDPEHAVVSVRGWRHA